MSPRFIFALFILSVVCAFGQQPNMHGEPPRISRNLKYGNWVGKRVLTKEFMEQVGIGEEQAKKLKEELDKLDARSGKLEEEINTAALEQAEIAKKVLAEPGANTDEVMKKIEHIGKLRTEQAKLTTLVLVAIRDNLTEEQRKKANELITAEGKKRMQERMLRREREDRNGPQQMPNRPAAPKGW
jgi:Spy/CpxP family protein refolding chaperone